MINQKQMIFSLICLYTLANTPVALCDTLPVIYVAGDGTGNFNCNGTNDQVQINQALEYAANHPGTTVYLKGPFVYDIGSSCLIGSNTELTGDSSAKLRLANYVGWTTANAGTPIIGQIGGTGSIVHDIKIHGFEINGNEGAQSGSGGLDLYRIISFRGSSTAPVYNIRVYNMNLHDAKGEGFRCTFGKNIYYYNNVGNNLQHTCVMYSRVNSGEIHNNIAHQCSCAGDRLDNCQNIIIDNETISPYSGVTTYVKDSKGYAVSDVGVQIVNSASSPSTSNIIIRDCNIMSGVNGVLFDSLNDASNVNCYDNVIHDSGYENEGVTRNGGIGISNCGNGITIQNNDITGSYVAGINVNTAISDTHTVAVKNNNIIYGKTMNSKPTYAVKNNVASQVSLILNHNYITGYTTKFYPSSLNDPNPATSPNIPVLPIASFTASTTSGTTTSPITFTDTSNTPTSWSWNFGDSSALATTKNVSHTFSEAGTYTITLTVKNAVGSTSTSKTITIAATPVASFTVSPTSGGTTTTTYTFTDTSTNTPTIWTWNFGDGGTGSGKNVTHKYTTAKTYTVTLTAGNTAGNATATKSVTVSASNPTKSPVASFTYSPTAVKKGVTIKFTDTSTNMPNTWKWTFGDGSAVVTSQNPTHVFSKTGSFKISLAVYNKVGSNSATKFITVS